MNKLLKYELCTTCSILGTTFLLGSGLVLSNFVSADTTDAVDTLTITVNNSCSIARADGNTGSYSSAIANGNTGTITGTTFKTTCNDSGGYSIYAVGYSNDTDSNTDLIAASPLASDYNIATGTATSGSTSNWAMKLAAGADGSTIQNSYSGFKAVPSTYTKVTTKASGTTPASTTTATITYQVYIANEQPAGTYTGKVKYVLVYSGMTNLPVGYKVNGNTLEEVFGGITTMQAMTTSICANAAVGDTKQLKDTRDNKYYWVTKLADNNCWMTQNLDFNIDATTAAYLNSTYTDLSSTWSPDSTYYTKTTTSSSSTNTDYHSWDLGDYYYVPSSNTGWTSCGASATSYSGCTSYGFSTTKPTADAKGKTLTSAEAEHYQVGTLYQWCAATAGTCSGATTSGATASGSICPKGWRLPYSGNNTTDKGFGYLFSQSTYNLISSYDKLKISADPLYFVPGGYVALDTLWDAGYNGLYWSSQAYDSSYAYGLYFISSGVTSTSYSRYYGRSVRCVAK